MCYAGLAYVGFSSEKDMNQALGRNKNFIGGKRIFLKTADKVPMEEPVTEDKPRPWEIKQVKHLVNVPMSAYAYTAILQL